MRRSSLVTMRETPEAVSSTSAPTAAKLPKSTVRTKTARSDIGCISIFMTFWYGVLLKSEIYLHF